MPTPQSKTIGLGPHFFGQFEKNDYCPGNDAETIRQEVALAKEKLRKHPKFFERFGSTKPKRKFS